MYQLSKVLLVDQNFTGFLVYRVELYKFYLLDNLTIFLKESRNTLFFLQSKSIWFGPHLLKGEQVSVILRA